MTTSTHARATAPRGPQSSWVPGGRLLRAEFLKLTRRRGLMIAAVGMAVGAVLAYLGVAEGLHLSDPGQYGPAGGLRSLSHAVYIIEELAAAAAILLGAAAGAGDASAGVFRNLVSTGRSRAALFLARIPAGLAVSVALTLAAYAVAAAASVAFAGKLPAPPAHLLLAAGGWLAVNTALAFLLGLGLSALIGSRSTTIAVLLGLTLVVTPIAAQVSALPDVRQALPGIALFELQPRGLGGIGVQALTMTTTAIAVVLVAWAALAVGAGLWRTITCDT
jgi:ABC-type transport system involved in multi-copper enzyme maturation permease subunit